MRPQDNPPSLHRLEEDIQRFQRHAAPRRASSPQGAGLAMRVGAELASGVLVGAGVGIALDRWLGTSPVLCILCFLLGAGAGFRIIYRTSQAMDGQTPAAGAKRKAGADSRETDN